MQDNESQADDANSAENTATTTTSPPSPEIPERFKRDSVEVVLGSREDAVIDTDNVEREWIPVTEEDPETGEETMELYWFDMSEVSWERKTEILDQNLNADERTEEVNLDLIGYYRDMMEEVIVDMSVEGSLPTFLKGMNADLGNQLQNRVPQPDTMMEDVDEGKSAESSEDE